MNNHKMMLEISADPLTVTSKLMEKNLIPPVALSSVQLQTREKEVKATELVTRIYNKVEAHPENFKVFLEVLNEMPWLKQLANCLTKDCEKLKVKKVSYKAWSYMIADDGFALLTS